MILFLILSLILIALIALTIIVLAAGGRYFSKRKIKKISKGYTAFAFYFRKEVYL